MDGLSAAASGMAVISLTLQLVQLTQNLRAFINDVSGAPSEIRRLAISLTQLANILQDIHHISEIQHAQEGSPPPPPSLLASLETCKEQLLQLQSILALAEQKLRISGRLSKQWESFKVVFKKKDIEIFGAHLDQSVQYLTVAMTMNLMLLNLSGLEMTTSIAKTQRHPISRTVPARQFSDLYHSPPNKGISRRGLRYTNTSRSVTSYSHSLGGLGIAIAYTQQTRTQQKEHSIEGQDIFRVRDYVLELSSTILGYYFRLCFRYIYGSISHSLQVDPVSNIADPIFYLCLDGEVSAVQSMLAEKSVSPFVRDHSGDTLLHHAAAGGSSEMMKLLLQCGIDGSKTDHFFNQTPLQWTCLDAGLLDPDCDDSVDTIRTLIFQGHNDPLNLDFRGDNFITGYIGNAEGYLWVLCQEEFEVDILNAGDRPLHVIARSLAFQLDNDITCSPSRSWEPALRRLIKLGVPPISTGLGTKVTPLDTLLTSIESQVSSGPIAREWLTLLSSVGVDIEEYISVERGTHTNGFVFPDYPGPELLQIVPRQIIFEERGNRKQLNIEWKWFYDHQSPAHLALTEFSTFGNLLSGESSVWELTWPFIHIEAHKNLYLCRSVEDYKRMLSKLKILEARWTRQAARRQRRSEFIARFIKPSRSERQRRVPGSWVEDHVSVSASWQVTRVSRISGRLFLFTLGVIYFSWLLKVRGLETAAEKELSIVLQSLFLLSVSLYLFVRKGRSYC